jgi:hypothetical protein
LSFQDEREGRRRRKPETDRQPPITTPLRTRKKRSPEGDVGGALRSAYQRMIDEDIPPEMLDLLGKLG